MKPRGRKAKTGIMGVESDESLEEWKRTMDEKKAAREAGLVSRPSGQNRKPRRRVQPIYTDIDSGELKD